MSENDILLILENKLKEMRSEFQNDVNMGAVKETKVESIEPDCSVVKSIKQDGTDMKNVSCTRKAEIENNELRIVVTLYPEVESDISEENKFGTAPTNLWSQNENRYMNDEN